MTAGYFLQAGQPAEVRQAFLVAMGLEEPSSLASAGPRSRDEAGVAP
jgi:hypothetical protein